MSESKSLSERLRTGTSLGTDLTWLVTDVHLEAADELDAKDARIAELTALTDRLKLEAQCHASEARTANSTIYEIYQVLSGATGEPGNWHGAEPARKFAARLSELTAERDELVFLLNEGGTWEQQLSKLESRLSEQAKLLDEAREVVSAMIMARDKVAFRAARALLAKLNALHQENKDGK